MKLYFAPLAYSAVQSFFNRKCAKDATKKTNLSPLLIYSGTSISMSRTLIITADDFGFSPSVNEAVLRAAEFGTLHAASLMVNMPFAEEAVVAMKQRVPTLSLGLHVTLTSGKACTPKEGIPLLVDTAGYFKKGFGGLFMLLRGKNRADVTRQIQRELSSQLSEADRLAKEYSIEFDRLDSHQHVHVLPGMFDLFLDEAVRRNWTLRIPRERFGSVRRFFRRFYFWGLSGLLKREILKYFLPPMEAVPMETPDYFGILDTGKINAAAWREIIAVADRPITEVNVHPSLEPGADEAVWQCSEGDRMFHRSAWRRREFDALLTEKLLVVSYFGG